MQQQTRNAMNARHIGLAAVCGLAGALMAGLVAGLVREDRFWTGFVVFAALTFAPIFGFAWTWLGDRRDTPAGQAAMGPDSIEHQWAKDAGVAAMRDLILVLTVATAMTAVFDIGHLPAPVFLVIALVDWFGRTLLLEWRER